MPPSPHSRPAWPPRRQHHGKSTAAPSDGSNSNENGDSIVTAPSDVPSDTPSTPLRQIPPPAQTPTPAQQRKRKQFRNGFEVTPSTPSYKPYQLSKEGYKRMRAFDASSDLPKTLPLKSLDATHWQDLAINAGFIPTGATLRPFQVQCANVTLSRSQDVCVIAPTGAGKSLLWCLPLLVAVSSISLIVTPYTSLGQEGEARCVHIFSIFM